MNINSPRIIKSSEELYFSKFCLPLFGKNLIRIYLKIKNLKLSEKKGERFEKRIKLLEKRVERFPTAIYVHKRKIKAIGFNTGSIRIVDTNTLIKNIHTKSVTGLLIKNNSVYSIGFDNKLIKTKIKKTNKTILANFMYSPIALQGYNNQAIIAFNNYKSRTMNINNDLTKLGSYSTNEKIYIAVLKSKEDDTKNYNKKIANSTKTHKKERKRSKSSKHLLVNSN